MSSKLALTKVVEFLAAEHPSVFTVALNSGIVETAIFHRSGQKVGDLPMDTVELPAHFIVWLASPEAAFLSGRYVSANWDVAELKTKAEDFQSGPQLTAGIHGWPFPYV
ncbi:uncharacterized protein LDX57_002584 [Aspergillus melleus]|uniref:uncharacterized protein n=1 Tax=Aspergillus melleus TaxID=138277 RepID=UPI001E8D4E0C|nr:uncharacterized protein LDX57_002584 [Aspergillus melleus]KAH8424841.1 hypothetical protein LDX57_002584 [Aspergillus melleus]